MEQSPSSNGDVTPIGAVLDTAEPAISNDGAHTLTDILETVGSVVVAFFDDLRDVLSVESALFESTPVSQEAPASLEAEVPPASLEAEVPPASLEAEVPPASPEASTASRPPHRYRYPALDIVWEALLKSPLPYLDEYQLPRSDCEFLLDGDWLEAVKHFRQEHPSLSAREIFLLAATDCAQAYRDAVTSGDEDEAANEAAVRRDLLGQMRTAVSAVSERIVDISELPIPEGIGGVKGRHLALTASLEEEGLSLRGDSALCQKYVDGEDPMAMWESILPPPDDDFSDRVMILWVVSVMKELQFFHSDLFSRTCGGLYRDLVRYHRVYADAYDSEGEYTLATHNLRLVAAQRFLDAGGEKSSLPLSLVDALANSERPIVIACGRQNNRHGGGGYGGGSGACYTCGEYGHFARDCDGGGGRRGGYRDYGGGYSDEDEHDDDDDGRGY